MAGVVELRCYRLVFGSGARFHELVSESSVPLQRQFGIDVVAFGPSEHDADCYFLVRAFADAETLKSSLERFYASDEWQRGPRQAIVELIQSDTELVVTSPSTLVELMRDAWSCG